MGTPGLMMAIDTEYPGRMSRVTAELTHRGNPPVNKSLPPPLVTPLPGQGARGAVPSIPDML